MFGYLLLHLSLMPQYGLSWDYHYHHYAGLYHLGLPVPSINDVPAVPFTPPDPRLTIEDPFGPFIQIIPSFSQVVLHDRLGWLPFDMAYNLPIVVVGSLGVGVLYFFLFEVFGVMTALAGSISLALLPVWFGYVHTNMKDVPNAVAFTAAVYCFWRLARHGRVRDLFLAAAVFAVAFNIKINSFIIPVVCGIWWIMSGGIEGLRRRKGMRVWTYFLFAPIAAAALWWPFWRNPLGKLLELPSFFSGNTINMPVLFNGEIVRSGINIPPVYPYVYLAITTPLPILVAFLLGLGILLRQVLKKNDKALLLLVWFFVPLVRYLSPQAAAIDGVRHFMEVVFPLCAIAGVGAVWLYGYMAKWFHNISLTIQPFSHSAIIRWSGIIIIIASLLWNLIKYHPYQTSYFNSLAGGIRGAQGKFDMDFWGAPQKEAMLWLNAHAGKNAIVHIVMAQSSAAVYLRDDLRVAANSKSMEESDYVVLLNRQSFFSVYPIDGYRSRKTPADIVYKREIDDVPLVWIYKN